MEQPPIAIVDLQHSKTGSNGPGAEAWLAAASDLQKGSRHVAFVAHAGVHLTDLYAAAASDADVTIIVADSSTATCRRASSDLAAALWQSFPSIAALASERVEDAGAVVFSASAFEQVQHVAGKSPVPIGTAVDLLILHNRTLRAVCLPEVSRGDSPENPAELVAGDGAINPPKRRSVLVEADLVKCIGAPRSTADIVAVRAGLLLWHDLLEASHTHSQSIEGEGIHRAGDFWHAIMHRREGDFGNSKYWYRRVGKHPLFDPLAQRVRRRASERGAAIARVAERLTPGGQWSPSAFVDACQISTDTADFETALFLRQIQSDEMLLLLWQTCLDARGEN